MIAAPRPAAVSLAVGIAACLLSAQGVAQEQAPPGEAPRARAVGDLAYTVRHGDSERKVVVHVPSSVRSSLPAPVVLALHGGAGSADHMARDELYGLTTKAGQVGFVVVYPNGWSRLREGRLATWNAGLCCGAARDRKVDDVGFLRAVVDDLATRVTIDRARIYAVGMSNGAMMAYRLACEAPDLVAGIMAVAGTDNTARCEPSRPVSILHVHARNDDHVAFEGGAGPAAMEASKITHYRSVPDTVSTWVRAQRCETKPVRVLEVPGAFCERYTGCAGGTRVQLCVTERGGHSWPGGTKPRALEQPSKAVIANDLMWDFFGGR